MNMNDIWITCDVFVGSFEPVHESVGPSEIAMVLLAIFLIGTLVGVVVFAIYRIIKMITSKANKNAVAFEDKQVDVDTQKDDNNQLK